jgi:hypothetical protein
MSFGGPDKMMILFHEKMEEFVDELVKNQIMSHSLQKRMAW